MLSFVDNLGICPKDSGYLVSILSNYETELVEQPLLLTQPAERPGQQFSLFRGINVSVLPRRIDQRPLVYLIEAFGLLPLVGTPEDVMVYDSLEPGLE